MSTLSPDSNANVSYEAPVQTPSAIGALANIGAAFARQKKQPSASALKEQREQTLRDGLVRGLRKANSLRAQGRYDEAMSAERQTREGYFRLGGNAGEEYNNIVEVWTGNNSDRLGMSEQEHLRKQILDDDAFKPFLIKAQSQNPDATQDQQVDIALLDYEKTQVAMAEVELTKANWNTQKGQASRLSLIQSWQETNLAVLNSMGPDGEIPVELDLATVQGAKASFFQLQSQIAATRPAGIPNAEWEPIENALSVVKNQLNFAEVLVGVENITNRAIGEMVTALGIAAEKSNASDATLNAAIGMLTNDKVLAAMSTSSAVQSQVVQLIDLSLKLTPEDYAETVLPTGGDPASPTPEFTEKEVELANEGAPSTAESFDRANALFGVTLNLAPDQETAQQWVEYTAHGLASLEKSGASSGWLSKEGYRKYLGANFQVKLETIRDLSPAGYAAIKGKTLRVLDTHETAITTKLKATVDNEFLSYNADTRQIDFDLEAFTNSDRISNISKQAFITAYNENGRDLLKTLQNSQVADQIPSLFFGAVQDKTVKQMVGAVNQIQLTRQGLLRTEELQGGAGNTTLDGSQGGDNLASGNGPIAQKLGIDFDHYERTNGLPSGFLERMAMIESSGNPNAKNPNSSAGGLFQQINSNAKQWKVADRFDPVQSTEGAVRFAVHNKNFLEENLGRPVQAWELYLAHQQGHAGALKLLRDPTAKAVDLVGKDAIRLNGGHEEMSAGEFARIWAEKYSGGRGVGGRPLGSLPKEGAPTDSLRPQLRPEGLSKGQVMAEVGGTTEDTLDAPVAPSTEALEAKVEQSKSAWEGINEQKKAEILSILRAQTEDISSFASEEELRKAFEEGTVGVGDIVTLKGQVIVL